MTYTCPKCGENNTLYHTNGDMHCFSCFYSSYIGEFMDEQQGFWSDYEPFNDGG